MYTILILVISACLIVGLSAMSNRFQVRSWFASSTVSSFDSPWVMWSCYCRKFALPYPKDSDLFQSLVTFILSIVSVRWQYYQNAILSLHCPTSPDLIACSGPVTYAFQSECTLYSCLNVNELLPWSKCEIWSLIDSNWTRTNNHVVHKQTLNHLAKLAKWLNFVVSTYL